MEDVDAGNTQAGFAKGQTSLAQGTKPQPALLGLNKNRRLLTAFFNKGISLCNPLGITVIRLWITDLRLNSFRASSAPLEEKSRLLSSKGGERSWDSLLPRAPAGAAG